MTRKVLLLRHGRPLCDERTPIGGIDFAGWVGRYDNAPLDMSFAPPARVCAQVAGFDCVVTSTLRRSRESADLLTRGRPALSDAVFDEAGIPTKIGFRFRLPPRHWDAAMRAAWLCGWSGGVESLPAAQARAVLGATRLASLAGEHGRVLLVGHGMMNWLLARELRRAGWRGPRPRTDYWCSALFTWKGFGAAPD